MIKGQAHIPEPVNEPVLDYAPGSPERKEVKAKLDELLSKQIEIPLYIGGEEVTTGNTAKAVCPHDHQHVLATYHKAGTKEIDQAIEAALAARQSWASKTLQERAAVFLKAADLITGKYRATVNAACMLGQSKNIFQAEIDAVCELADFLRYNAYYAQQIYANQPDSGPGEWNMMDYRPLEGFVFAVTPFNFLSIGGNLPSAPALMGNTVVWKPASSAMYGAYFLMQIFREAGLPDGVINMLPGRGSEIGAKVLKHPELAGIHFTGSTETFQTMWKTVGENIDQYHSYPRLVGETGGKDFILMHPSADVDAVATAMVRGAFEYQGQKCSAASRTYVPRSLWPEVWEQVKADLDTIKVGDVTDFRNFMNAVIDENAFNSIVEYIEFARDHDDAEIVYGGGYDDSEGWFIEPTVIVTDEPSFRTACEEIFGPVLTVVPYDDDAFDEVLETVDSTSPYALTGAIFATDRAVIEKASEALRYAAGNYYINDKPTGAVVGRQPFGGARASGTNDKAGSYLNLLRWVSPRTIKENFMPATGYRYPFMAEE